MFSPALFTSPNAILAGPDRGTAEEQRDREGQGQQRGAPRQEQILLLDPYAGLPAPALESGL